MSCFPIFNKTKYLTTNLPAETAPFCSLEIKVTNSDEIHTYLFTTVIARVIRRGTFNTLFQPFPQGRVVFEPHPSEKFAATSYHLDDINSDFPLFRK